jgi:hypothetical protein
MKTKPSKRCLPNSIIGKMSRQAFYKGVWLRIMRDVWMDVCGNVTPLIAYFSEDKHQSKEKIGAEAPLVVHISFITMRSAAIEYPRGRDSSSYQTFVPSAVLYWHRCDELAQTDERLAIPTPSFELGYAKTSLPERKGNFLPFVGKTLTT